jgi:hypothetical protein
MIKLERKSDRIKILESDSLTLSKRNHGYRCLNCKEQYQLIANPGDKNNLKCLNCGALTPLRSVKHSRGLAEPAIQTLEQTALVQSDKPNVKGRDRRPKGIHTNKNNELEQSLISKGFQVTDIQVVEP